MDERTRIVYRQLEERYVKVAWTHKIHECQSDLYIRKHDGIKKWMAILAAIVSTSAIVTLFKDVFPQEYVKPWIISFITTILSVVSTYFTLRFKDAAYLDKAKANKVHASKCHDMRNKYESALTDIKSNIIEDYSQIIDLRNSLENMENIIYSNDSVPYTSCEAVDNARRSLIGNNDSQTQDSEIRSIVPEHLQVL